MTLGAGLPAARASFAELGGAEEEEEGVGGGGGGWGLTRPGPWGSACLFIYFQWVPPGVCARSRCSAGRGWGEGPRPGGVGAGVETPRDS